MSRFSKDLRERTRRLVHEIFLASKLLSEVSSLRRELRVGAASMANALGRGGDARGHSAFREAARVLATLRQITREERLDLNECRRLMKPLDELLPRIYREERPQG